MKQKIIYLFVFISCLAFLSSARQLRNHCLKDTSTVQEKNARQINQNDVKGIDISPLFHIVFSIY